jgi:AraC-like DNA-binding protein
MEHAERLLADRSLSIMDVCNSVGFESIGTFSGLFKKEVGLAPNQFRHKLIHRKKKAIEFPAQFIPSCFCDAWNQDKSNNGEKNLPPTQ